MPAAPPFDLSAIRLLAAGPPAAQLLVLFGSVARRTPMPWSDVDVAIAGLGFWPALDLGTRIGRAVGREAHVVELEHAPDLLRYHIARDGVLLHQAQPDLWRRVQAASALRYFALAPLPAICADGARKRLQRESLQLRDYLR